MKKITENDIELMILEKLEDKGFNYLYGPKIVPDGERPERETFADVLLLERLE